MNSLNAVGIRVRLRPIERAAFNTGWREKELRGLFMVVAGNSGNAARRVAEFHLLEGKPRRWRLIRTSTVIAVFQMDDPMHFRIRSFPLTAVTDP